MRPVVIGITGASGAAIARAAVEMLLDRGHRVMVTHSAAATAVWRQEMGEELAEAVARWQRRGADFYDVNDMAAPIASGTFETAGMAIVPCSMNTAAALAHGMSGNLLQRAADVTIKERRRLVVVPRETPLSVVHLRNLLSLARVGVVVLPAMPAFYLKPRGVEEIVEFLAARTLDALGVEDALGDGQRYQG